MARVFNPAPGWPTPPEGWTPPSGWEPDATWPPAPYGWPLWLDQTSASVAVRLGEKVTDKHRNRCLEGLAPNLDSSEQVVSIFKTTKFKPAMDTIVITDRRILGFDATSLPKLPRIAIVATDILAVGVPDSGIFSSPAVEVTTPQGQINLGPPAGGTTDIVALTEDIKNLQKAGFDALASRQIGGTSVSAYATSTATVRGQAQVHGAGARGRPSPEDWNDLYLRAEKAMRAADSVESYEYGVYETISWVMEGGRDPLRGQKSS